MANELHARPFPKIDAPAAVAYVAFQTLPSQDREHDDLLALFLKHHGAEKTEIVANHMQVDLGAFELKWERHSEFVTYTLFQSFVEQGTDGDALFSLFPADWSARE